jgi:hypothetical protein
MLTGTTQNCNRWLQKLGGVPQLRPMNINPEQFEPRQRAHSPDFVAGSFNALLNNFK